MKRICILFLLAAFGTTECHAAADIIPASDPTFLGSVLSETWDTRAAAAHGYIDGMMPLSDVDLTVLIKNPGVVALHFDTSIYPQTQGDGAGPTFEILVDGVRAPDRITVGPKVPVVATAQLQPGRHRVRFVASSNTSSPRWNANDPQIARVTGVEIPAGSTLEKSQRPTRWFLAITDSIGEGALNMNTTRQSFRNWPPGGYTDSDRAWPAEAARLLHESICGYLISGIGIVRGGTGTPFGALNPTDPSGASDPWDHIFAGAPRPFDTAPDFIILCVGTNEWATDPNTIGRGPADPSSADAPFAANVETFFARVRGHSQLKSTPIYVSVPFGGFKRTALQKAVADFRAAHPDEKHIELFDVAFGSPDLKTTTGIDEHILFGGLTKNRPDDADTVPSAQACDRTHPYAIATPAIGTVNAHLQLAEVIAPRLHKMLAGEPAPKTGGLKTGELFVIDVERQLAILSVLATGGSAPYTYQFETSSDGGQTWIKNGDPILSMQVVPPHALQPPWVGDKGKPAPLFRLKVTDSAEPPTTAVSKTLNPATESDYWRFRAR
jgi:hypothetical protein